MVSSFASIGAVILYHLGMFSLVGALLNGSVPFEVALRRRAIKITGPLLPQDVYVYIRDLQVATILLLVLF